MGWDLIFLYGYPVYETQDGALVARNTINIFIPHQFSQCVVEMELLHQLCVINKGRNPGGKLMDIEV